jgi:type IV pilus assembly protein PilQ
LKFGFPVQHIFNGSSNSVNNTGGNGLILLGSSQEILNIELEALENEGKAKIISRPRLLTQNGEKATIESGQEIPYEQSVAQGVTSTTFKKAVLSLSVTPEVLPNKTILLSLTANQDKPSDLTVKGVPAVDTQKIETMVMIKSGETVVLGGIHERTQGTTEKNVPVLSKIPAIGLLFSNKKTVNDRRELLIFVTPKIVSGK